MRWPGRESNPRHTDFQSVALPTELPGRLILILPALTGSGKITIRAVKSQHGINRLVRAWICPGRIPEGRFMRVPAGAQSGLN